MERYYRLERAGKTFYGLEEAGQVRVLVGDIFCEYVKTDQVVDLAECRILPPVLPKKVLCIGLNYSDHAAEVGAALPKEPVIFMKPTTTVIGDGAAILHRADWVQRLDYEAELAIVIGKKCYAVKEENAGQYIFGYTCANDVTARDLQPQDGQWTLAKCFDTFCPLGPALVRGIEPGALDIRLYLNGELRQQSNTKNLIFKVPQIVSYLSQAMTLEPGDVIITGTPSGIGNMVDGDEVVVEIEGLGRLRNVVKRIE